MRPRYRAEAAAQGWKVEMTGWFRKQTPMPGARAGEPQRSGSVANDRTQRQPPRRNHARAWRAPERVAEPCAACTAKRGSGWPRRPCQPAERRPRPSLAGDDSDRMNPSSFASIRHRDDLPEGRIAIRADQYPAVMARVQLGKSRHELRCRTATTADGKGAISRNAHRDGSGAGAPRNEQEDGYHSDTRSEALHHTARRRRRVFLGRNFGADGQQDGLTHAGTFACRCVQGQAVSSARVFVGASPFFDCRDSGTSWPSVVDPARRARKALHGLPVRPSGQSGGRPNSLAQKERDWSKRWRTLSCPKMDCQAMNNRCHWFSMPRSIPSPSSLT